MSIKIVNFSTVSINLRGLIREGKKSRFESLIYDLALSWVYGTIIKDKSNEKNINTNEYRKILFKNLILEIPFDQ